MDTIEIPTKFAPARRSPQDEILRQSHLFQNPRILAEFADAVPSLLMILNENRQIVHANLIVLNALGVADDSSVLGLRPGEALKCVHAIETAGGCGTTEFCQTCGAVRAILTCQRGDANSQECRIVKEQNTGSLDFRIVASPMSVENKPFTVFAATDISHEKRREALERVFFHDVLNTAGGLQGYVELMDITKGDPAESMGMMRRLATTLIDEIKSQQELLAAERGELALRPRLLSSDKQIARIVDVYRLHTVADNRNLVVAKDSETVSFVSDESLVRRVVGNMIKNALEASRKGQTVTVGCRQAGNSVEFWVHNEECMPREIQLQVFQRSFSTKGQGRGLGTYSIKLLGEKYLHGAVSFSSSSEEGTVFRISLPMKSE
jgi:signal transduction histidine kinase